ncbi:unnamed protein product [Lota lota]
MISSLANLHPCCKARRRSSPLQPEKPTASAFRMPLYRHLAPGYWHISAKVTTRRVPTPWTTTHQVTAQHHGQRLNGSWLSTTDSDPTGWMIRRVVRSWRGGRRNLHTQTHIWCDMLMSREQQIKPPVSRLQGSGSAPSAETCRSPAQLPGPLALPDHAARASDAFRGPAIRQRDHYRTAMKCWGPGRMQGPGLTQGPRPHAGARPRAKPPLIVQLGSTDKVHDQSSC